MLELTSSLTSPSKSENVIEVLSDPRKPMAIVPTIRFYM